MYISQFKIKQRVIFSLKYHHAATLSCRLPPACSVFGMPSASNAALRVTYMETDSS
jgi:hypothetical protein